MPAKSTEASLKLLRTKLRQMEYRITDLQKQLEWFGPAPIHDGKMTVQPIQWKS